MKVLINNAKLSNMKIISQAKMLQFWNQFNHELYNKIIQLKINQLNK